MEETLGSNKPGVIITGHQGTGKSALILQLVEYSCFGRRRDPTYQQGTKKNSHYKLETYHFNYFH